MLFLRQNDVSFDVMMTLYNVNCPLGKGRNLSWDIIVRASSGVWNRFI